MTSSSDITTAGTSPTTTPTTWQEGRNDAVAKCVLPLSFDSHKGSSGRVGVLGGSPRYTGAPYYAAMASLHVGADLAYVFCAQEAAMAIKCYSPELMVAPVYNAQQFNNAASSTTTTTTTKDKAELIQEMVDQVVDLMDRMHVLVIGPGLGRCPTVMEAVAQIIQEGKARNLSMIVDADALFLLTLEPYQDLFRDYSKVVLTPNVVEYKRLLQANNDDMTTNYRHAIVVQKGRYDAISHGSDGGESLVCRETGGMKRSGGLGDVLAGTMGTFVAWNEILSKREEGGRDSSDRLLSCWAACCVTKRATKRAFDRKKRAMTAPDVLDDLGFTINDMTEEEQE